MMQGQRTSIFRSEALEHYIQSRENNTLPRISRPPVFLCMWGLLGLCVIAIVIAYLSQVPVYISGSGVVLEREATVLVFFPTSPVHPFQIHVGAPVRLHLADQIVESTIERVETEVLSPHEAQQRYGLGEEESQLVTGPSLVAAVKLSKAFPAQTYIGSIVKAQVQIGTTRVFSLLLSSTVSNGE